MNVYNYINHVVCGELFVYKKKTNFVKIFFFFSLPFFPIVPLLY